MRILDTIIGKWNIVYAIIFVIATAVMVDIWESLSTVTLFIIALGILVKPYLQKILKYIDS